MSKIGCTGKVMKTILNKKHCRVCVCAVSTDALQQEVFCVEFACPPHVPHSEDSHLVDRWVGDPTLTLGVNETVNDGLSLSVGPPVSPWPCKGRGDWRWMDACMDGCLTLLINTVWVTLTASGSWVRFLMGPRAFLFGVCLLSTWHAFEEQLNWRL